MAKYILRLEKNGQGVYASGAVWDAGVDLDSIWHPSPYTDGLGHRLTTSHYFGFAGVRTYLQWFYNPEWRIAFKEIGVKLHVYELPAGYIISGTHQVMFLKGKDEACMVVDPDIFDKPNWQELLPSLARVIDHAN